jgi:RNA polymerase sigma-70 factor (ECF subfamily)
MFFPGIILALDLSGETGEDLARRLQSREPGAMQDLYDRFGKPAYSAILAIVHDASTAEDLTQETFLRVWNGIHAFEPGRGGLGPWLLAIARNRAIDHVHSSSKMDRSAFASSLREHPSLFLDMQREIENTDHARIVRSAIKKLNPNEKKALELAWYEGLFQTEMAERMGQPPGEVRTWLREAFAALRQELGQAVTS